MLALASFTIFYNLKVLTRKGWQRDKVIIEYFSATHENEINHCRNMRNLAVKCQAWTKESQVFFSANGIQDTSYTTFVVLYI